MCTGGYLSFSPESKTACIESATCHFSTSGLAFDSKPEARWLVEATIGGSTRSWDQLRHISGAAAWHVTYAKENASDSSEHRGAAQDR